MVKMLRLQHHERMIELGQNGKKKIVGFDVIIVIKIKTTFFFLLLDVSLADKKVWSRRVGSWKVNKCSRMEKKCWLSCWKYVSLNFETFWWHENSKIFQQPPILSRLPRCAAWKSTTTYDDGWEKKAKFPFSFQFRKRFSSLPLFAFAYAVLLQWEK